MLYDLEDRMLSLQESAVAPEEVNFLDEEFEEIKNDFEDKFEDLCKIIKNIQGDVKVYADEITRLQDKKKRCEDAIDRIKKEIEIGLNASGKDRMKGKLFTISMRNNAPQLPKDLTIENVPDEYIVQQEPKIDRVNLLKAVKTGEVDGIELVKKKSLQIK